MKNSCLSLLVLLCSFYLINGQLNGVSVQLSPKFINSYTKDMIEPYIEAIVASLNFIYPTDIDYSNGSISANFSNINVQLGSGDDGVPMLNSVSFVPNLGFSVQISQVYANLTWNMVWKNGSYAGTTEAMFDMECILQPTGPNFQNAPTFQFNSTKLSNLSVKGNYNISSNLQNVPNEVMTDLLQNQLNDQLSGPLNNWINNLNFNGPFIFLLPDTNPLSKNGPIWWYAMTNSPMVTNDTLGFELCGDISLFPLFGEYCTDPHGLPPITPRQHDIEIAISLACFTCVFGQVVSNPIIHGALVNLLNGILFPSNEFAAGWYWPWDYQNITFVPATNTNLVSVKTEPLNITLTLGAEKWLNNTDNLITANPFVLLDINIELQPKGEIIANITPTFTAFPVTLNQPEMVNAMYANELQHLDPAAFAQFITHLVSTISIPLSLDPLGIFDHVSSYSASTSTTWVKFVADLQ